MFIVWGSKLYGKVDVVPEFFHVETKFGHVNYLPLIPFGSFLVLSKDGDGFRGVKIPLSFRSVLLAWLRVATLIVGIWALILTAAMASQGHGPFFAAIAAASLGAFAFLKRHRLATRASYDRACKLADLVGLSPDGRKRLEAAYGYKDGVLDPFEGLEPAI